MRHISSLTPVHIEKGEKSYLPVERLRESLMGDDIHNIALTGPFGSGKSSVIRTLVEEEKDNYHFLQISLATLDVKKGVKSKADFKLLTENGNPKFKMNDYNKEIISVLEDIGYISSKKEQTGSIRVYTKNK